MCGVAQNFVQLALARVGGAPGILLALVLPVLIRDPRHCADSTHFETAKFSAKTSLSTKDAVREVFASKAYL